MLTLSALLLSGLAGKVAYLDPGSGSFILQLLIAGLAGMGIFIGVQWKKFKSLLLKKKVEDDDEETEDGSDAASHG